jgi:chromosome segregation ATPase
MLSELATRAEASETRSKELELQLTALGVRLSDSENSSTRLSESLATAQASLTISLETQARLQTSLDGLATSLSALEHSSLSVGQAATDAIATAEGAVRAANARALGWGIGGSVVAAAGIVVAIYAVGHYAMDWW